MSFLFVKHEPDRLNLAFLLDYSDEATVSVSGSDQAKSYDLTTDEGVGSWLILESNRPFWGAQIRRDDTPYNDCLPPTETLLTRSFSPGQSPTDWAKEYRRLAENGFYNPADTLVGSGDEDQFLRIQQSFQIGVVSYPHGTYRFQEQPDDRFSFEKEPDFPEFEPFKEWVRTANNPDGMRPLHAGVYAEYSNDHWETREILPEPS